jgi:hypothetical protein
MRFILGLPAAHARGDEPSFPGTALDKFIVVVVIGLGVWCGWFFLDDLQCGLAKVRRALDPADREAATRGGQIVNLHKAILVGSAAFVVWIVLWKLR